MNVELMQQSRRRRHRSDRGSAWQRGRYLEPHLETRSRVHGRDHQRAAGGGGDMQVKPESSLLAQGQHNDTGTKE